ncbi:MAG TPA: SWIM zinc finger family protein, partial [Streptosporangiaceae bacterium]|nr:SWIM zinc finger family protein [Streptosporangiaceae bacterium]
DVQTTHAEGRARRILTWRGTRSGTPPPAAGQPSPRVTTSPREFYAPTVRTAPRTATTMPPEPPHRESSADKAKRLLVLGAVVVRRADDDGRVLASVQGDNDLYRVQRTAGGDWSCSCPSGQYGGPCSHRYAVGLVTGHAA